MRHTVATISDPNKGLLNTAAPEIADALEAALIWWHSVPEHFHQREPGWVGRARVTLVKAGWREYV